ncbi:MAG: 4-hydroxythreonine-4-phosphate dehydrogenase PdxA [Phycisphaeraceae bacterium]|nr:4-hydroxythreonine-4-phosphate dehydrogenase PdxA [Phycisphaeraceae bacterium]
MPGAGEPANGPTIAISVGDPMGIGPETIVKALSDPALRALARFIVIGPAPVLLSADRAAADGVPWRVVDGLVQPGEFDSGGEILVLDDLESNAAPATARGPGVWGGEVSFRAVCRAIELVGLPTSDPLHADAMVTAPISKEAWTLAGHPYPGHTELLAERLESPRSGMLFVGPSLRVILVTIHVPLREVPRLVTPERVLLAIELGARACRDLGIESPRIAVCGLNPHAGEHGLLGTEDSASIAPAIAVAREAGIDATGPHPADAVFLSAAAAPMGHGRHDLVVAMYHDQGLIPAKLADGRRTVNVTVGLETRDGRRVIRTSPAHGTAFDIAGRGKADATSMRSAIELAVRMVGEGR